MSSDRSRQDLSDLTSDEYAQAKRPGFGKDPRQPYLYWSSRIRAALGEKERALAGYTARMRVIAAAQDSYKSLCVASHSEQMDFDDVFEAPLSEAIDDAIESNAALTEYFGESNVEQFKTQLLYSFRARQNAAGSLADPKVVSAASLLADAAALDKAPLSVDMVANQADLARSMLSNIINRTLLRNLMRDMLSNDTNRSNMLKEELEKLAEHTASQPADGELYTPPAGVVRALDFGLRKYFALIQGLHEFECLYTDIVSASALRLQFLYRKRFDVHRMRAIAVVRTEDDLERMNASDSDSDDSQSLASRSHMASMTGAGAETVVDEATARQRIELGIKKESYFRRLGAVQEADESFLDGLAASVRGLVAEEADRAASGFTEIGAIVEQWHQLLVAAQVATAKSKASAFSHFSHTGNFKTSNSGAGSASSSASSQCESEQQQSYESEQEDTTALDDDEGGLALDSDSDKGTAPAADSDSDKGTAPAADSDSDKGTAPAGDSDSDNGPPFADSTQRNRKFSSLGKYCFSLMSPKSMIHVGSLERPPTDHQRLVRTRMLVSIAWAAVSSAIHSHRHSIVSRVLEDLTRANKDGHPLRESMGHWELMLEESGRAAAVAKTALTHARANAVGGALAARPLAALVAGRSPEQIEEYFETLQLELSELYDDTQSFVNITLNRGRHRVSGLADDLLFARAMPIAASDHTRIAEQRELVARLEVAYSSAKLSLGRAEARLVQYMNAFFESAANVLALLQIEERLAEDAKNTDLRREAIEAQRKELERSVDWFVDVVNNAFETGAALVQASYQATLVNFATVTRLAASLRDALKEATNHESLVEGCLRANDAAAAAAILRRMVPLDADAAAPAVDGSDDTARGSSSAASHDGGAAATTPLPDLGLCDSGALSAHRKLTKTLEAIDADDTQVLTNLRDYAVWVNRRIRVRNEQLALHERRLLLAFDVHAALDTTIADLVQRRIALIAPLKVASTTAGGDDVPLSVRVPVDSEVLLDYSNVLQAAASPDSALNEAAAKLATEFANLATQARGRQADARDAERAHHEAGVSAVHVTMDPRHGGGSGRTASELQRTVIPPEELKAIHAARPLPVPSRVDMVVEKVRCCGSRSAAHGGGGGKTEAASGQASGSAMSWFRRHMCHRVLLFLILVALGTVAIVYAFRMPDSSFHTLGGTAALSFNIEACALHVRRCDATRARFFGSFNRRTISCTQPTVFISDGEPTLRVDRRTGAVTVTNADTHGDRVNSASDDVAADAADAEPQYRNDQCTVTLAVPAGALDRSMTVTNSASFQVTLTSEVVLDLGSGTLTLRAAEPGSVVSVLLTGLRASGLDANFPNGALQINSLDLSASNMTGLPPASRSANDSTVGVDVAGRVVCLDCDIHLYAEHSIGLAYSAPELQATCLAAGDAFSAPPASGRVMLLAAAGGAAAVPVSLYTKRGVLSTIVRPANATTLAAAASANYTTTVGFSPRVEAIVTSALLPSVGVSATFNETFFVFEARGPGTVAGQFMYSSARRYLIVTPDMVNILSATLLSPYATARNIDIRTGSCPWDPRTVVPINPPRSGRVAQDERLETVFRVLNTAMGAIRASPNLALVNAPSGCTTNLKLKGDTDEFQTSCTSAAREGVFTTVLVFTLVLGVLLAIFVLVAFYVFLYKPRILRFRRSLVSNHKYYARKYRNHIFSLDEETLLARYVAKHTSPFFIMEMMFPNATPTDKLVDTVLRAEVTHPAFISVLVVVAHAAMAFAPAAPVLLGVLYFYRESRKLLLWDRPRRIFATVVCAIVICYMILVTLNIIYYYFVVGTGSFQRRKRTKTEPKSGEPSRFERVFNRIADSCTGLCRKVFRRDAAPPRQDDPATRDAERTSRLMTRYHVKDGAKRSAYASTSTFALRLYNLTYAVTVVVMSLFSLTYVCILLLWILLSIFVNPVAAIPVAIAILATAGHIVSLKRRMESYVAGIIETLEAKAYAILERMDLLEALGDLPAIAEGAALRPFAIKRLKHAAIDSSRFAASIGTGFITRSFQTSLQESKLPTVDIACSITGALNIFLSMRRSGRDGLPAGFETELAGAGIPFDTLRPAVLRGSLSEATMLRLAALCVNTAPFDGSLFGMLARGLHNKSEALMEVLSQYLDGTNLSWDDVDAALEDGFLPLALRRAFRSAGLPTEVVEREAFSRLQLGDFVPADVAARLDMSGLDPPRLMAELRSTTVPSELTRARLRSAGYSNVAEFRAAVDGYIPDSFRDELVHIAGISPSIVRQRLLQGYMPPEEQRLLVAAGIDVGFLSKSVLARIRTMGPNDTLPLEVRRQLSTRVANQGGYIPKLVFRDPRAAGKAAAGSDSGDGGGYGANEDLMWSDATTCERLLSGYIISRVVPTYLSIQLAHAGVYLGATMESPFQQLTFLGPPAENSKGPSAQYLNVQLAAALESVSTTAPLDFARDFVSGVDIASEPAWSRTLAAGTADFVAINSRESGARWYPQLRHGFVQNVPSLEDSYLRYFHAEYVVQCCAVGMFPPILADHFLMARYSDDAYRARAFEALREPTAPRPYLEFLTGDLFDVAKPFAARLLPFLDGDTPDAPVDTSLHDYQALYVRLGAAQVDCLRLADVIRSSSLGSWSGKKRRGGSSDSDDADTATVASDGPAGAGVATQGAAKTIFLSFTDLRKIEEAGVNTIRLQELFFREFRKIEKDALLQDEALAAALSFGEVSVEELQSALVAGVASPSLVRRLFLGGIDATLLTDNASALNQVAAEFFSPLVSSRLSEGNVTRADAAAAICAVRNAPFATDTMETHRATLVAMRERAYIDTHVLMGFSHVYGDTTLYGVRWHGHKFWFSGDESDSDDGGGIGLQQGQNLQIPKSMRPKKSKGKKGKDKKKAAAAADLQAEESSEEGPTVQERAIFDTRAVARANPAEERRYATLEERDANREVDDGVAAMVSDVTTMTLENLGISQRAILMAVITSSLLLVAILVFIFIAVIAFSNGSGNGAANTIINSLVVLSAAGATNASQQPGDETESDAQLTRIVEDGVGEVVS